MNKSRTFKLICKFISSEIKKRNSSGVVLGLSGGLDSTVCAYLAREALGPDKIFCLLMPDYKIDFKNSLFDALEICKILQLRYKIIDITEIKSTCSKQLPYDEFALGNLTARLRMSLLYYYANLEKKLVLGTTDKSELKLGYFTKFGDGGSDILPIADLYKTEVRELGQFLQIPSSIINKTSSPGLWDNHTAEKEIGLSYEKIDAILKYIDNNNNNSTDRKNFSILELRLIKKFMLKNKHKTKLSPICKIN